MSYAKSSLALLTAAIFSLVLAIGTPAGEEITNQATVKYIDSTGEAQTANSNEVITIVKQVYGVSLVTDGTPASPGQSQNATPGNTVYYPYTLTNTGNGTDSFTLSSIINTDDTSGIIDPTNAGLSDPIFYIDTNGDGVVQPGEPKVTSVDDLAADEEVKLIMAYQIPSDASPNDEVIATPVATSTGDTSGNTSDGDGPVADTTNNYHKTTVVQDAVMVVSKAASVTQVSPGGTITFTVKAVNNGSSNATTVTLADTAPAGTTIVGGSVTTIPAGNAANTSVPTAIFATVVPGQEVEMSFDVTVDAATPPGNIENTADVTYTGSTTGPTTTSTNTTTTEVLASYSAALGPKDDPTDGDGAVDGPISYATAEGYTVDAAEDSDAQVVATANAGTTVSFINSVSNEGTGEDTFNITLDQTGLNLPAGASVLLTRLDGTPLSDTDGDGNPDSGPLDPGEEFDFITQILLPQGYDDSDGATTTHEVVVTATSSEDPSQSDTTSNSITDVVGPGVNFGNNTGAIDNDGAVDNASPVDKPTDPGATAVFPMDIVNTGSSDDSYDLTGSVDFTTTSGGTVTVPVVYYPASADTNGDGTLSDAEISAATPITNTGSLDPNEEATVFAVVDVPADAQPQTVAVSQTASSPLSGASADFNTDTVTVNAINDFTLSPDRNGTAPSPGTVIYQHTLTNNGNRNITDVDITDSASGNITGWTYLYSYDGVTYYPAANLPAPSAPIAPGESQTIFVKVNVPAGVPQGAANVLEITAAPTFSGDASSTGSDSVVDTTVVISGELTVVKEWSLDGTAWYKGDGTDTSTPPEVAPGEDLIYRMTITNIGTGTVGATEVLDSVPTFTDFVIASEVGTATCSSDGGTSYVACPAGSGIDTSVTGIKFDIASLAPGASVTVRFTVRVQ